MCTIQRRDALGVDLLTGLVLSRKGEPSVDDRVLETPADWFAALADIFHLPLPDVTPTERAALWARLHTAHEAWAASG